MKAAMYGLGLACLLLWLPAASARDSEAQRLLLEAAEAMGGLERLQALDNLVMTGFGQRYSSNGNISPDPNAPPKWQSATDSRFSFDLKQGKTLQQERNSFQYPLAASFGHSWALGSRVQEGVEALDHPLAALLAALDESSTLGPVSTEEGKAVLSVTVANGETFWLALDTHSRLPYWLRRISGNVTLGDVALTTWFTGYVPVEGLRLPLGLLRRLDWRDQVDWMFQVDAYHLNVESLPDFPAPPPASRALPEAQASLLAPGVWDVRIPGRAGSRGGDGGPVVEFADHLVMFEAYGDEEHLDARLQVADSLVPGKRVEKVIVSHHHEDHAGALRGAVARGLTIIAEAGNQPLFEEWVSRAAVHFPDALALQPRPLRFEGVHERLVLEDAQQRLEVYQVIGHAHMSKRFLPTCPTHRF